MLKKKQFKNIIFDLDGTLINSEKGIKNALNQSFLKETLNMYIKKKSN